MMDDMLFDGRSALHHYRLELTFCSISTPVKKQNLLSVPTVDGSIDLMQTLGPPRYEMRTVTARFNILRRPRETVARLLNELEGQQKNIVLPDRPAFYVSGVIHVASAGSRVGDTVQLSIRVFPWRYAVQQTVIHVPASDAPRSLTWRNGGTRDIVPEITVPDASVSLIIGDVTIVLEKGTHLLPALSIPGGSINQVSASGGAFTVRYREAIL